MEFTTLIMSYAKEELISYSCDMVWQLVVTSHDLKQLTGFYSNVFHGDYVTV